MKKILELLWEEYLMDKFSRIDTSQERELTQKIIALHEQADALLDKKQQAAVQKYADALCELDALFSKKAFIKGCEFSVLFLAEALGFETHFNVIIARDILRHLTSLTDDRHKMCHDS